MKPRAAEPRATGSHQAWRPNNPHVAAQNPTIVIKHSTRVTPHNAPDVDTPRLANSGVSHSHVLPASKRATPPRFRIVNTPATVARELLGCNRSRRRSLLH